MLPTMMTNTMMTSRIHRATLTQADTVGTDPADAPDDSGLVRGDQLAGR